MRLLVDGEWKRPVADETLGSAFPSLLPPQHLERVPPGGTFLRAYAFAKLTPVRQEFELRFDPARMRFPP